MKRDMDKLNCMNLWKPVGKPMVGYTLWELVPLKVPDVYYVGKSIHGAPTSRDGFPTTEKAIAHRRQIMTSKALRNASPLRRIRRTI